MSLDAETWERVKPLFGTRAVWVLMPGKRDAYVPLFEGTLDEAVVEAFRHATFWETTTTVIYSPMGRLPEGRVPIVKVSPISSRGMIEVEAKIKR